MKGGVRVCNYKTTLLSISNRTVRLREHRGLALCRTAESYRRGGSGGRGKVIGGYLIVTSASFERLLQGMQRHRHIPAGRSDRFPRLTTTGHVREAWDDTIDAIVEMA